MDTNTCAKIRQLEARVLELEHQVQRAGEENDLLRETMVILKLNTSLNSDQLQYINEALQQTTKAYVEGIKL